LLESLRILRALSGETRIKLVRLLCDSELCVCELEYILDLSQPAISQQVRILREAGIATARRQGNWIFYHIDREDLEEALDKVRGYLTSQLSGDDDAMRTEWKRLKQLLSDPPDHCPGFPRPTGGRRQ